MYSNVFDTLIFDNELKHQIYTANVQGMFYSSIVSGLHPTLSMNQAVDSPAIHAILSDAAGSDFLKLIQSRIIRISRYTAVDPDTPDAIDAYILPKLAGQKYCEFSSLPFLNRTCTKYTVDQKAAILKKLLECYTTSGLILDTAFRNFADADDSLTLYHWADNLRRLKAAVSTHYLPCSQSVCSDILRLYKRVLSAINISVMHSQNGCPEEFIAFRAALQSTLEKALLKPMKVRSRFFRELSSRSGMYRLIRELQCSRPQENELKALVDICYNEIVAESISDTEDAIMISSSGVRYAEILLESENVLDKDEQKLALAKSAIEGHHSSLNWAALNDILHVVNEKYGSAGDLDKWYILMQDTLAEMGIKNVSLKQKKLLMGTLAFTSSAAASIYGLLEKSDIGLALGSISLGVSALNMIFTSHQNSHDLKIAEKKLPIYQEAQELLTQTALLKHSYNDPK